MSKKESTLTELASSTFKQLEYDLCDAANLWRRATTSKSKEIGISLQEKRALMTICRYPGLTQAELAKEIDLEPQNLIRILDKLSSLKWIEKKNHATDRRAYRLHITSKAEKAIRELADFGDQLRPQVLKGLSKEETKMLHEILIKIKANFSAISE